MTPAGGFITGPILLPLSVQNTLVIVLAVDGIFEIIKLVDPGGTVHETLVRGFPPFVHTHPVITGAPVDETPQVTSISLAPFGQGNEVPSKTMKQLVPGLKNMVMSFAFVLQFAVPIGVPLNVHKKHPGTELWADAAIDRKLSATSIVAKNPIVSLGRRFFMSARWGCIYLCCAKRR